MNEIVLDRTEDESGVARPPAYFIANDIYSALMAENNPTVFAEKLEEFEGLLAEMWNRSAWYIGRDPSPLKVRMQRILPPDAESMAA